MPKPTQMNWKLSINEALLYNAQNKEGVSWDDLLKDFLQDTNQMDRYTDSEWESYSTYFRQKVRKIVINNPKEEADMFSESIAERMANLFYEPYDEMTPQLIHKLLGFPEKYFTLKQDITVNAWGGLTIEEFAKRLKNGQIKVKFQAKNYILDWDELRGMLKTIKPIEIKPLAVLRETDTMKFIPFFDLHFGFMGLKHYKPHMDRTIENLSREKRKLTVIPLGQDLLHNNDLRGNTANGTPIEKTDMTTAIKDAIEFYSGIVQVALATSDKVVVSYSIGNHDESLALAVLYAIRERFPQVELDDTLDEYKLVQFGNCSIGYTHGDKVAKAKSHQRLHDYYLSRHPHEFTMLKKRYVFTGHYHTFKTVDENGTLVYTLATSKLDDKWHIDHTFVGSQKFLSIFEFDQEGLIAEYRI